MVRSRFCALTSSARPQKEQRPTSRRCFREATMLPSSGTAFAIGWTRAAKDIGRPAAWLDALEERMKRFDVFLDNFDKTLDKRFREQAEMLDERFAEVGTSP
jgi:hypothetical protein